MIVLYVIAAILGGLLLLFLTLLAIVLFVPFKLNIFASNSSRLTIKLKASWLFRLIKVYYEKKGDKSRTKIEVFFITLGKKKKKRKNTKADKDLIEKLPVETKEEAKPPSSVEKESEPESKPEARPEPDAKPNPDTRPKDEHKNKSKPEPKSQSSEDGIMARIEDAKKQFDYVYNHPDRDKLIRLTIKLCMELLRALKPKSFCIKGEIGTGDPALTGQLLGAIYIVRSFTGFNIDIKGDFENLSLNGEITVESNIYLYRFVVPLCKYALSRPVWKLIKKFLFRKDGKK